MNSSNDILRKALRCVVCRWTGCDITLSSFELLEKHYTKIHVVSTTTRGQSHGVYLCLVKTTKIKTCNLEFQTARELTKHIMKSHHENQMWVCPIEDCKANLRRFKTDEDLQDHLDIHIPSGGALPQAVLTPAICRSPPTIPKSVKVPYEVFSACCFPASFTRNRITKAKQNMLSLSTVDPTRAVSYLPLAWVDAEEDDSPAETKRRQTRGLTSTATRPSRSLDILFQPPRFSGVVLRAPEVSVGFDSPGFQQLAKEAFAIVEAEGLDEETEIGSSTQNGPTSDVELDSE